MKHATTSVLISRSPRHGKDEFKTAVIKLFTVNDPHKTTEMPTHTFEHHNIEKVVIKGKHVDYYLEGNDLILNSAGSITIEKKGTVIFIS